MNDSRNTFVAVVVSLAILLGWQYFFSPKTPQKPVTTEQAAPPPTAPVTTDVPPPGPPGTAKLSPPAGVPSPGGDITPQRETAVAEEKRIHIQTPRLHGSISLTGLKFDDVTLVNFHEQPDPASPEITLLSPQNAPKPYFIEQGWLSGDPNVKLPNGTTVWTVDNADAVLTESTPLVAHWDNGEGLRFTRTIHVDKDFLFTVEQTIENTSAKAVTLFPYSLIARLDMPKTQGYYILHEGPLGVFNHTLKEVKYKDFEKTAHQDVESTGGWIGITDKYWLTAVALDQAMKITANFSKSKVGDRDRYQTDLRGDAITVAAGETHNTKDYVFAGAKEVQLLDRYAENPGIARFDLAVDWGWFYFLTKPFFYALEWLKALLGNFGLALLAFTTGLRLLMFPVANKQYAAMNKMKALQPQMKALQEKYANDREKLNTAMMELYKREKANPLAGCVPIVIQIPVFFALYKVLFVTIEMRHAPFFGWIKDLSAPDSTNIFTAFGAIPWDPPQMMHLGALPIIMGITMFLQQRLSPQPADPIQARMMMILPVVFTFMLASFPAGLVIYWTWSNLLGILQQWTLIRSHAPKAAKA